MNVVGVIDTVRTPDELCETDSEALKELCEAMRRDWVRLNDFLNTTAMNHQWCSDYEERLADYNRKFETLKLKGRENRTAGRQPDPYRLSLLPDLHFTYEVK